MMMMMMMMMMMEEEQCIFGAALITAMIQYFLSDHSSLPRATAPPSPAPTATIIPAGPEC